MRDFDWHAMWFPKWPPWEVALRAAITYVVLQLLVRLAGSKAVSRYSTADIVLVFLIAQAARQTIVGTDISITNAAVGLATLFLLDWLVTSLSARSSKIADIAQGRVHQLVRNGEVVEAALRRTHVSKDELLAQVRRHHRTSLDDVRDAYLERSGHISLIFKTREAPDPRYGARS